MIILQGYVDKEGAKDFTRRMTQYPEAFYKATGEKLIPGTLNIAAEWAREAEVLRALRGKEVNNLKAARLAAFGGLDCGEPLTRLLYPFPHS